MSEYEFVMTEEEAEAFGGERNRAKIPIRVLPPKKTLAQQGLTTEDFRHAVGNEGPLAGQWADKPHRLVYDLCSEIEATERKLKLVKERQCRIVGLRQAYESAQYDLVSAISSSVAICTLYNAWNDSNRQSDERSNPFRSQWRTEREYEATAKKNYKLIKGLYDRAVDEMMQPLEGV